MLTNLMRTNGQAYQVDLPLFQGPLDLLLHLIEREQLDITRVALAQVTDQYLAYLASMSQVDADVLTDFLVVAAKLLLIKSLALLPKPPPDSLEQEEEDPGDQLARQLELYRKFKVVAQALSQRQEQNLSMFVRVAAPPTPEPRLAPGQATPMELLRALQQVLARQAPQPAVDSVVSPVVVTIAQQIAYIRDQLSRASRLSFRQLLPTGASRLEIIVTFMALLELIKQHAIDVRQDNVFDDIVIISTAGQSAVAH